MLKCPHCGGDIALVPELAGQLVECPLCGGQFTMPPPLPPAPPLVAPIVRVTASGRRSTSSANDWPKLAKKGMLIATGIWLVAIPVLGMLFALAGMYDPGLKATANSDLLFDVNAGVMVDRNQFISAAIVGGMTSALCVSTTIYGIVMVALLVASHATKP